MSYSFGVTRGFLSAALIVAVLGAAAACALVIGDLPEATKSSTGGAGGTSGSGGESGGSAGESGSAGQTATGGTPGGGGGGATGGTGASGGSGGGGGIGAVAGSGAGASGGSGGCWDPLDEPDNNTQSGAYSLDTKDDCPATQAGTIPASLSDKDVDWFEYQGVDQAACTETPQINVWVDNPKLRVCAFAKCATGNNANLSCAPGQPVTAPQSGCCTTNALELKATTNCVTLTVATVFVRVDSQQAIACENYNLHWAY